MTGDSPSRRYDPNNGTGGLPPGSARRAGPTVPTRSLATDLWRYTGMSPANMQLYLDWYVYLFRVNQARDRWDPTARVLRHMMMARHVSAVQGSRPITYLVDCQIFFIFLPGIVT